jgi:hypothetical protein
MFSIKHDALNVDSVCGLLMLQRIVLLHLVLTVECKVTRRLLRTYSMKFADTACQTYHFGNKCSYVND